MSEGLLAGKTALLTGALGTLGRAEALRLRTAGARLILLDLPDRQGEGDEIARRMGADARYIGVDLSQLDEAERRVAALADEHPVDILVNNAALIVNKPFESFSPAEFEEQMRVNASAAFALARALAPGMKARRYGKIVNFCSLVLNGRWDGYVPYVASKGAVLGLTKSLARELGAFGIRVNAVAPGAVVSDAEERVFGDRLSEYNGWILENQSLKTRIQPEDVAELVCFLASPQSDMISGQNIGIDGGW
ncbi:SDR family oxidoreductase [Sphingomonas sp. 1P08PE]|uniref:SDR family oxidoreductase n=1 Tax=Sphingomonas sp. 1P08PE TaxID=554122 RepID=UPI0039A2553E